MTEEAIREVRKTFTITSNKGLHTRAAVYLMKLCNCFQCEISIAVPGRPPVKISNGCASFAGKLYDNHHKAVIPLTLLAASKGTELEITARGEQAGLAVNKIGELIEKGFYDSTYSSKFQHGPSSDLI